MIGKITPVGLHLLDLSLISKYEITVTGGNTTHTIELADGGNASITLNTDGTVIVLEDGMLSRRRVEGGTILSPLSEMEIDGNGHAI